MQTNRRITSLSRLLGLVLVDGLHRREEQHLLDVVAVGQEHGETIDTESPSSSGRKTVLESDAEVLVKTLGLLVSLGLVLGLLHESLTLHDGVVQLSVGVGELGVVHEQLEALAHARLAAVVLGERRHDGGVITDEGGVAAQRLHEVLHELIEETRRGERRRALDAQLLALGEEEIIGLLRLQRHGHLETSLVLQLLHHAVALPWGREIELDALGAGTLRMVGDLVSAGDVLHDAGDHILRHLHHVVHIGVRHVELARGELGVVRHIDRLVTELAAQLVHAVETTDHELLQVQLGSDTHVEVQVQVVVVGDEWLRRGATGLHVHHGRLHFQEAQVVQVAADASRGQQERVGLLDDARADDELVTHLRVHDQVQVTLAVARLGVSETHVGLREHVQAGREDLHLVGEDGELATLGAAGESLDSDDISTANGGSDLLEGLGSGGVERLAGHHLDLFAVTLKGVEEELLSRSALQNHTAGDRANLVLQMLTLLRIRELLNKLGKRVLDLELVGIHGVTSLLSLGNNSQSVLEVLGRVNVLLVVLLRRSGGRVGSGLRSLGGLLRSLLGLLLLHLLSSLQLILAKLL